MADQRRFELDDLLLRPGCYLNPQTEVMVVVDDSPSIDGEIFNMEEFEGADWVLIADEVPVDESAATSCSRTSRPPTTAATAAAPRRSATRTARSSRTRKTSSAPASARRASS